jgi:uncharacterized protein (TIGR03000 family)
MIRNIVLLATLAAAILLLAAPNAPAGGGAGYRAPIPFGSLPSHYGYPLDDYSAGYYGGGRYREYYNYGRGYGIANYPGPLPDYRGSARHPLYVPAAPAQPAPPPVMQGGLVAHINVEVPPDAQLWIEGQQTQQKGTSRTFVSPPLERNQAYEYRIRARWNENGQVVEQAQKVTVIAGERFTVSFPTGGKKDVVSTPRPFPLTEEE